MVDHNEVDVQALGRALQALHALAQQLVVVLGRDDHRHAQAGRQRVLRSVIVELSPLGLHHRDFAAAVQVPLQHLRSGRGDLCLSVVTGRGVQRAPAVQYFGQVSDAARLLGGAQYQVHVLRDAQVPVQPAQVQQKGSPERQQVHDVGVVTEVLERERRAQREVQHLVAARGHDDLVGISQVGLF